MLAPLAHLGCGVHVSLYEPIESKRGVPRVMAMISDDLVARSGEGWWAEMKKRRPLSMVPKPDQAKAKEAGRS